MLIMRRTPDREWHQSGWGARCSYGRGSGARTRGWRLRCHAGGSAALALVRRMRSTFLRWAVCLHRKRRRVLLAWDYSTTCFGLLRPLIVRARAKQLPALPGGSGEADGGQRYQSRWPSRGLAFRLEHHASNERDLQFCSHGEEDDGTAVMPKMCVGSQQSRRSRAFCSWVVRMDFPGCIVRRGQGVHGLESMTKPRRN